jgi:pentatricopeptide repeat protein
VSSSLELGWAPFVSRNVAAGVPADLACLRPSGAGAIETWLDMLAEHSGHPESAEKWFLRMLQDGHHPEVVNCNSVLKALAKQGVASGAERIVRLMCARNVGANVATW